MERITIDKQVITNALLASNIFGIQGKQVYEVVYSLRPAPEGTGFMPAIARANINDEVYLRFVLRDVHEEGAGI